eukprot:1161652-Pelagomonas_calceolata.AAC.9
MVIRRVTSNSPCLRVERTSFQAGFPPQFQHLFSSAPPSSASHLKDFMNQADGLGFAKFVTACLKCCAPFLLQLSCPRRQGEVPNDQLDCSTLATQQTLTATGWHSPMVVHT